jgi:2-polyprenyl-3-methyl-5-hydroxy-6-metoxy-1,4-benzoquinol methylase
MGDFTDQLPFSAVAKEPGDCVCWHPDLFDLRGEADYHGWRFRRCVTCDTLVLSPRPAASALADFYKSDYDYASQSIALESRLRQLTHNSWVRKKFNNLSQDLSNLSSGRKLLDYGCGYGRFLFFARDHFECYGYELNECARSLVSDRLSVPVASSTEALFDSAPYDIITMHHVLEHTSYPLQELEALAPLLSEGGLLVLTLPNAQSLVRKFLRERWDWNAFPVHNFHYSLRNLEYLIRASGFDVVSAETQIGDLPTPMPLLRALLNRFKDESLVRDQIGDEHMNTEDSGGRLRHLYYALATPIFFYLDPFRVAGRVMPLGSEILLIARKRSEP